MRQDSWQRVLSVSSIPEWLLGLGHCLISHLLSILEAKRFFKS